MARAALVAAVACLSILVSADAQGGFRVDLLGWDPFARRTTGWEVGLEVYATREEAEQVKQQSKQWVIFKSAQIVEVDDPPPPVHLPHQLDTKLPPVDENGNPLLDATAEIQTLAQYRATIDIIYDKARDAKQWATQNGDKLNHEVFTKVNALVEKYNEAIGEANAGPRAPYAQMDLLTPQDVFAAKAKIVIQHYEENHRRLMEQLRTKFSQLRSERQLLQRQQSQLRDEQSRIQREQETIGEAFKQEINELEAEFREIDDALDHDQETTRTQVISSRIARIQQQRQELGADFVAASERLRVRFDSWKNRYRAIAAQITDFNLRSKQAKDELAAYEERVTTSSETYVQLRRSVESYFGGKK